MPADFRRYGETWRTHHPEWEMRLWTDTDLETLDCRDALERARSHSERSDVIRYELLNRFGGVYIDADVECLRPIEPLVDGVEAFAAYHNKLGGSGDGKGPSVGSAVVGSAPGHPIMERAAAEAREQAGSGTYPGSTGPEMLTRILADFPDFPIFDAQVFYPYSWREPHRRSEDFPDSYAVHHWATTWIDHRLEHVSRALWRRIRRAERRAERAERRAEKAERRRDLLAARLAELEQGLGPRAKRRLRRWAGR